MIARGKGTKEHEDFQLLSKRRVFSCLFLLVTRPASPSFCCRRFCDFGIALQNLGPYMEGVQQARRCWVGDGMAFGHPDVQALY